MLQNWLKPIKGHNGPVPALNVIPEPGRNRVKFLSQKKLLGKRKTTFCSFKKNHLFLIFLFLIYMCSILRSRHFKYLGCVLFTPHSKNEIFKDRFLHFLNDNFKNWPKINDPVRCVLFNICTVLVFLVNFRWRIPNFLKAVKITKNIDTHIVRLDF